MSERGFNNPPPPRPQTFFLPPHAGHVADLEQQSAQGHKSLKRGSMCKLLSRCAKNPEWHVTGAQWWLIEDGPHRTQQGGAGSAAVTLALRALRWCEWDSELAGPATNLNDDASGHESDTPKCKHTTWRVSNHRCVTLALNPWDLQLCSSRQSSSCALPTARS